MTFVEWLRRTGLAPGSRNSVGCIRIGRPLWFRKPRLESLEDRRVLTALPFGAEPNDTAEFMLGRVAVTPILLESNGQLDASTENWSRAHIDQVLANLTEGLDWWEALLRTKTNVHTLDFVIDRTFADQPVPSAYEPINRVSNDYALWTQEFLTRVGYAQASSLDENMRAFNSAQRQKANTDWAFSVFIVNSEIERDGTFAPGGSFSRAFGFAGGLFFVTPSTRPASTFAHETGHMFWARDEYIGGSSYYQQRGYYNTQNLNAFDNNPDPAFQQSPSIMSSGTAMEKAFNDVVSPASTLAMVGWQDTDGDGIFDLLDVPLRLEGVGRVDVTTGSYRFTGNARAQALPNRNSSGLGNDITLNKVRRIEARLADGPWMTVSQADSYATPLELAIPLGGRQSGTLQLRAVDSVTGVTSNVFEGVIGTIPDATTAPGINGFVWNDANANGLFDASETGLGAQEVRLVGASGQPLVLQRAIEPDEKLPGPLSSSAYNGVALSALGADANGNVGVFSDSSASTGARVFRPYSIGLGAFADTWNDRRQLKIEFGSATTFVSVDIIGSGQRSYGRLELYDASGQLLERATTGSLAAGTVQTLSLGRATADVAYAVVRGHMSTGIKIDNIHYGPATQSTTDAWGRYGFANLPAGSYTVQLVLAGSNAQVTSSAGQQRQVGLQTAATTSHIDFGTHFENSAWHNVKRAEDVNDDGYVTALDALLVINLLNQNASLPALNADTLLFSPYLDVSNDAFLSALDALLVINVVNGTNRQAAGEAPPLESSPDLSAEALANPSASAAASALTSALAGEPTARRRNHRVNSIAPLH